jgi:cholesterol transport system auxiliary component
MNWIKQLGLVMLCLLLTSCLSPVKTPPITTYMVNTVPTDLPYQKMHPKILLIMPPQSDPFYDTTQIVYTRYPHQIAYFGRNEWAETPSEMLQSLLIETFHRTHYFMAVVTPPFLGNESYILDTEIIKFQENFIEHPALMEILLRVRLSEAGTHRIIATREFYVAEPILKVTPYQGVLAANRAAERLLRQVAVFCLEKVQPVSDVYPRWRHRHRARMSLRVPALGVEGKTIQT